MPSTIADLNELTAPASNDFMLVRDVSDVTDRDKKMQLQRLAIKSGTPTAGRVTGWLDANQVQDGGFAVSDIARLSTAQSFTSALTALGGVILAPYNGNRSSGMNGWISSAGITVSAANTVICSLRNVQPGLNDYFGVALIWARNGTSSSSGAAGYVLMIGKQNSGALTTVEIAKGGLTTGAGASYPSFTFSVDATN